jgi:hypothetical protein
VLLNKKRSRETRSEKRYLKSIFQISYLVSQLSFLPFVAHAATINAASCSQANVQSAITSAVTGDTVMVPAGSCSWGGLTLSKAIHLQGAGVGVTNITLTGTNSFTKSAAGVMRITNMSFSVSGGGDANKPITINGSWKSAQPIVWQNNAFTVSGSGLFRVYVAGGVIFAHNTFTGDWDDSFLQLKDDQDTQGSWKAADTIGSRDTNGDLNIYIEDNTFLGGSNQGIDCDDACRMVNRHNVFTNSESNSHGKDTSPNGMRQFEIYGNNFKNTRDSTQLANENQAIWLRGGTGVVYDNTFDNLAGNFWGTKNIVTMNIRSDAWTCSPPPAYPLSHQLGQNNNGTSDFTDPIYFWHNTWNSGQGTGDIRFGADYGWGNGCNQPFSTYFQWGRDAVNNDLTTTPKPGYTAYTYPHPLVTGGITPPSDTTAPSAPTGLAAAAVSSSQINLSWSASTDDTAVTGYRVERCQGSGCTTFAQVATPSGITYSDNGLSASTLFRYRVRATDAAGNLSAYSSIANATTLSGSSGGPAALPQGNGLAAAYPNDVGITANPNVLFFDDFESYTSAGQLTSSGKYDNMYSQGNFAIDTSAFFAGTKSVRIRMPSSSSEISNGLVKNISPTRDSMYMRVYTRFQPNYAGIVDAHNGLRITGKYKGPGIRPDGQGVSNGFLVNIENTTQQSEAEPGYTHAYVYQPENTDVFGENWYPDGTVGNGTFSFGQFFIARPKQIPTRGTWTCWETLVQLNTPGLRDGRVAVWQDGVLIADWQNVRFRDVSTLQIDQIELDNGGKSSTQVNDKWYDNLVIAASYIGPMSTASTVSACDVNSDNSTNVSDVQLCVNQAIGAANCTADINKDGACNVIDVQRVVNAALGGQCVTQ